MVKATIVYDLADEDDRIKYKLSVHADEAYRVLWDVTQLLRGLLKYGDVEKAEDVAKFLKELEETLYGDTNPLQYYE